MLSKTAKVLQYYISEGTLMLFGTSEQFRRVTDE